MDIDFDKIDRKVDLLIIATQQNKPKLSNCGYFYTIDKMNNDYIYWKCERTGNKTTPKCSGRAVTLGYKPPIELTVEHNHKKTRAKF